MVRGFERLALIFLGGAVVVALGIGVFGAVSDQETSDAAPTPERTAPQARGAALGSDAALRERIDVVPPPWTVGYDLDAVAAGAPVPRSAVIEPAGHELEAGEARKWFVRRALPLVLLVNETILTERGRLWDVRQRLRMGEEPSPEERLWLAVTADRYRVSKDNLAELARRLDAVPPSIILAVVGRERRWTVRSGGAPNAGGASLATQQALSVSPGSAPEVAEEPLDESIRNQMHAVNTKPQFSEFRQAREQLRKQGVPLDGEALIQTLPSSRSPSWLGIDSLRAVISSEQLDRFDGARLEPRRDPSDPPHNDRRGTT